MSSEQEQIALWRDTLGADASRFWSAMDVERAPPMRPLQESRAGGPAWRWLSIAACVVLAASVLVNVMLVRELGDARHDFLLARLADQSPAARFVAINALSREGLSADAVMALESLVLSAADPNVQLAALDVLIDSGALSDDAIANLVSRAGHNTDFLRLAVRARSTRI